MDRKLTIQFYKITKRHPVAPNFEDVLERIFSDGNRGVDREVEFGEGLIFRLERFSKDGSFVDGEIVRRQIQNIPPEVDDDGLNPLPLQSGAGLGHVAAFRYHVGLNVIAVQFDNRSVSMSRFLSYMQKHDQAAAYEAKILAKKDALERYNSGNPTKFVIKIANPETLEDIEGEVGSILNSSKKLSELTNGPVITLEASMGQGRRRDSFLNKSIIGDIVKYFLNENGNIQDVRTLSVNSIPEDGGTSKKINFLQDVLHVKEVLTLPENDPDKNYAMRQGFIKNAFNDNFDEIQKVYGTK